MTEVSFKYRIQELRAQLLELEEIMNKHNSTTYDFRMNQSELEEIERMLNGLVGFIANHRGNDAK